MNTYIFVCKKEIIDVDTGKQMDDEKLQALDGIRYMEFQFNKASLSETDRKKMEAQFFQKYPDFKVCKSKIIIFKKE